MTIPDVGFLTACISVTILAIRIDARQRTHGKILCMVCKKLGIDLKLTDLDCDKKNDENK